MPEAEGRIGQPEAGAVAAGPECGELEHSYAHSIERDEFVEIHDDREVSLVVDQVLQDRSERLSIVALEGTFQGHHHRSQRATDDDGQLR